MIVYAPYVAVAWFVILTASSLGIAAGLAIAPRVASGSRRVALGSMFAWVALAAGFSGLVAAQPGFRPTTLVFGSLAAAGMVVVDLVVSWLLDPWRPHRRFDGRSTRRVAIAVATGLALIAVTIRTQFDLGPIFGPLEIAVVFAMGVAIDAIIRIAAMSRSRGRSVAHE